MLNSEACEGSAMKTKERRVHRVYKKVRGGWRRHRRTKLVEKREWQVVVKQTATAHKV